MRLKPAWELCRDVWFWARSVLIMVRACYGGFFCSRMGGILTILGGVLKVVWGGVHPKGGGGFHPKRGDERAFFSPTGFSQFGGFCSPLWGFFHFPPPI